MSDPLSIRQWAIGRIEHFLKKLDEAEDPLEIEAQLYTIMTTTKHAYEKLHEHNCQEV